MVNKITIKIALILFTFSAHAGEICDRQNLGWHFYCDPKHDGKSELTKEQETENAKQELGLIKQKLDDLKITAVMNPTVENIKSYIAFQQQQLDKASAFSKKWQEVTWQTPELDSLVKNPISTIGNEVRGEIKREATGNVLAHLNERYGLFFFYSSKCVYCHKFSPIVKVFASHYKLEVMAVSMDGGLLPEWSTTVINNGEAERLGMTGKPVPAVILFDSKNKKVIPVGFGLLTFDQLEERIYRLVSENNGEIND